jgi:hypothetical protein
MKKSIKFLAVFLSTLSVLYACEKAEKESLDDKKIESATRVDLSSVTTTTAMKGICVFADQADAFVSADWDALAASPTTDYIFIPNDAGTYLSTQAGYIASLAPKVVDFVNQLKSRKATSLIWIGTPGIGSGNSSLSSSSLNPFYNFITNVQTTLGTTTWSNNIAGVYMNMEAVYGIVDYTNLTSNICIKLMNDLSYRVRANLSKKFLWIPYYGYGTNAATIIKNIGYVANKSTIFDYVVIQPHYYFDSTIAANITGVQSSVSNQGVRYQDGVLVTPKLSTTIIGAEMEMSWKIVPPNNYTDFLSRYNAYITAFGPYKNIYPIIFYWDGAIQPALTSRVNPFYL